MKANMYGSDPSQFTFNGQVEITILCLQETNEVKLHSHMLTIASGSVTFGSKVGGADDVRNATFTENKERQILIFHLNKSMKQNETYFLSMNFSANLTGVLSGFYLSSYKNGNETRYLATTQFESSSARKAFPCFDEPEFKATFDIILVRKPYYRSTSNMPKLTTEKRSNGMEADIFQTTPKMSTYLVAFVISDFKFISGNTSRGLKFEVWARQDALDQLQYALKVGTEVITKYEEYFNQSFPLPKQGMIAIPDFGMGAMENWGLVTYREVYLLYKPGTTSKTLKQKVLVGISHELAHMWFGDLVTPKWWDDLWLNEGFATFVQYMGADLVEPGFEMYQQFVTTQILPVFRVDGLVTSHPVYVNVTTADEIDEIFDDISYNKGATVIRMLKFFLGDGTFQKGLCNYIQDRKYSNADHNDLWRALHEQAIRDNKAVDVVDTMETWTLQMNYPVVSVRRVGDRQLQLQQSRFMLDPDAKDPLKYKSKFEYKWNIPFTFTTSAEQNFVKTDSDILWVMRNDGTDVYPTPVYVPDSGDGTSWILGNVGLTGLYRVQYEEGNWLALINQLNTDHTVIYKINRAQIINDAWDLARAGILKQDIALKTVEYLDKEVSYYPWTAAAEKLAYVSTMLQNTELYGRFKYFMQQKTRDPFLQIGLNDSSSTQVESYARALITSAACGVAVPECVDEVKQMFNKWKRDPDTYRLYPEQRQTIICTGIAEGDPDDWSFVFDMYRKETDDAVRDDLMFALACTKDESIIRRLLNYSITPSIIGRSYATKVIYLLTESSVGQPIVWDFIRSNWDLLITEYNGAINYVALMITDSVREFNTQSQLREIEDFVLSTSNLGIGRRAFEQAIEQTKANIKWMAKNYPTVKTWLEGMPFTGEDLRLPKTVKPVHYNLEIKPNMYGPDAKNFTFEGQIEIFIICLQSSNKVILHINKLTIASGTIVFKPEDNSAENIHYVSHSEDKKRQFLTIKLNKAMIPNARYVMEMNFSGPLVDDLTGLYLSSYKKDNNIRYLATTHFESSDARKAFPCFDEPQLKASFNITLVRKKHYKSTSNMPKLRTEDRVPHPTGFCVPLYADGGSVPEIVADGFQADLFAKSPLMSTYLVAFVISDFTYITGNTSRGLKLEVWAREDAHDQLQYALAVGLKIISGYEDYFNQSFPLPKQGMIAIPDFAMGAMENWGLVTYRESYILYKPGVTKNSDKQTVLEAVAHEFAHMWFGDLVTPKWWDDLWLNEGFATFVEYMGADMVEPEYDLFNQFVVKEMLPVFNFDGLVTSHPIYVNVSTEDEVNEIFDDISYSKGGTVLRMLKFFLGDRTFQRGLAKYIQSKKYSNADHNDLWRALDYEVKLEKRNDVDVVDTMETWTLQMNYPVVMVTRQGSQTLRLVQSRFLLDPDAKDPLKYKSDFGYKWNIPFTFTTRAERVFNKTNKDILWINRKDTIDVYKTQTLVPDYRDKSTWILGNVGLTGLYKVNYEESNWLALINQLNTDHGVIDTLNRAQIITDAWDLARAGMLKQDIALKTVEYLDKEISYYPWTAATEKLAYVSTMLQNTEMNGFFTNFMHLKTTAAFLRVGLNDSDARQTESLSREIITKYACAYSSKDCVTQVRQLFQDWKRNPNNKVLYPQLRQTIICTGIADGDSDDWTFVYEMYRNSTEVAVRDDLMYALACSKNASIIHTLLQYAITPSKIGRGYSTKLIYTVTESALGQSVVWEFIKANWNLLITEFSKTLNYVAKMITGSVRAFNTPAQLKQIEDFVAANHNLGVGARAFQQAIEQTKANIRWMNRNYPVVKKWLKDMQINDLGPKYLRRNPSED